MSSATEHPNPVALSRVCFPAARTAAIIAASSAAFHGAFLLPEAGLLILGFLVGVLTLGNLPTARQAFYSALVLGLLSESPHLRFLWRIFGPAAIPLWLILPFWLAVFTLCLWHAGTAIGPGRTLLLAPWLWCGFEWFRSEVWWLRFSWLTVGSALGDGSHLLLLGVYGAGLALCALAASTLHALRDGPRDRWRPLVATAASIAAVLVLDSALRPRKAKPGEFRPVKVAGLQLEFPSPPELIAALDSLVAKHPETELVVLPEYTFEGTPPDSVREWCRKEKRWLVGGGRDPLAVTAGADATSATGRNPFGPASAQPATPFRNTAFVVSPTGEVAFSQAKAQPIQFFQDGLPAERQEVWNSPWGPVGIAICYDASYRRVTDELVRQGARALVFPTMDVEDWGAYEHGLNARQARVRSGEYRVPVLRVASSGPSQLTSSTGHLVKTTGVPEPGAFVAGTLVLDAAPAVLPLDRWLAPVASGLTLATIAALAVHRR